MQPASIIMQLRGNPLPRLEGSPVRTLTFVMASLIGSSAAMAQTCQPHWETLGPPGVTSDGYVAPMLAATIGGGEGVYIGGSFSAVGGFVTRGIARWNPSASAWSDVGGGCYSTSTNYFVASLSTFDFGGGLELVSGGSFATAGGVANTASLARWNGTRWAAMPGGQPNGAVWAGGAFNSQFVIGGGFTSVGTVAAQGIARLDANGAWQPLGSGVGGGFSPNVFAMRTFNDGSGEKLYVGGRFTSIGGVAGMIARWNGSAWEPLGGGVAQGSTFAGIESMAVFDDGDGPALYVGGWDLVPFQSSLCSVAKWNGTRWTSVGQYLGGRTTSLAAFDDGGGPSLYAGGTAQPGINYIARLVGNQWTTLGGGVAATTTPPFPSVFGLLAWNDRLIVGGDFDTAGGTDANGIAVWHACPTSHCNADYNNDGDSGTDQDIEAFFACLAANCCFTCPPDADFDGDGDVGTDQDIEAFFRVLAGGTC